MNDTTRKDIVIWCKSWDNDQCQKCGNLFCDLEKDAQIKEEMGGKPRILPVYTVDHKDSDSSHNDGQIDVDENNNPLAYNELSKSAKIIWHKYGNCRRLCWPCNRIEGFIKRKSVGSSSTTREKQDRINNEAKFVFEVEQQINERGHVCYKAICKAGKSICDSSEITCQRYLDGEIKTPENLKAKFESFNYSCDGKFCNGTHVSHAGVKPDVIIEEERLILEREWELRYSLPPGNWDSQEKAIEQYNLRHMNDKWIPKEVFIKNNLKLCW